MSLPRNVSKDCNGRWNLIKEKPAIIRESSIIRILQTAICIFPVQILIYCYPLNGISLFILYAITLFETLLFYHGGIGARNKKSKKLAVTGSISLFLKILEKPFPLFFYLFNASSFPPSPFSPWSILRKKSQVNRRESKRWKKIRSWRRVTRIVMPIRPRECLSNVHRSRFA